MCQHSQPIVSCETLHPNGRLPIRADESEIFTIARQRSKVMYEMELKTMKPACLSCIFLITIFFDVIAAEYDGICINEILASNASTYLEPNRNNFSDWIELYNAGDRSIDLRGCYLSDDPANLQQARILTRTVIEPKQCLLIWADGQRIRGHVEFALKPQNEMVSLVSPDGERINTVYYHRQFPDISYGRQPDGSSNWVYFSDPTPASANPMDGIPWPVRAQPPRFSVPAGFYERRVIVELASLFPNTEIRYTLDGSIPMRESTLYEQPIRLFTTTVIRARAFEPDRLPSETITKTYFISASHTLPVVSIATAPANFWDDQIGIYVTGKNGVTGYCSDTRKNWNQDWERPIHLEFFESDGALGFHLDAGTKIFG
ncbi:MAG: hypothetical protein C4527_28630 [Candidatus Omnitrophota bacterium]|jgi:hypothetical protein|nr:MAG: hypothetical protein C4527_28630 [Candidatus Omnitrophota bacterium]